ncbi:unnamed protein product [Callosobruchus maculatus]|uniref:Uncharacterized protein n=1 Tax=Callosobruchus maculatus TaxID=64391 RepID=A0A653D714_CALMS|nr:unnamed protein product [Callosobruchus maculatus]
MPTKMTAMPITFSAMPGFCTPLCPSGLPLDGKVLDRDQLFEHCCCVTDVPRNI